MQKKRDGGASPTSPHLGHPSPVSVCFIGKNRAGSWAIRGEQMASARSNWKATLEPTLADLREFDVYCIVKHPQPSIIGDLKRRGKAIVYDVLDSWAQPDDGLRYTDVIQARNYFSDKWRPLGIDYFIFAGRTMKQHLGGLVRYGTFIYHHHWPNIEISPPKPQAKIVAYEGNTNYLGPWLPVIERVSDELGLKFVINPERWTEVDIGVAVRGGEHDSFLANHYKSNVKLANFYGAGVPAVMGHKEAAYHETDNGDVRFFRDEGELRQNLQDLLDYETRRSIHKRFLQAASQFSLAAVADVYEHFFLWTYHHHEGKR